MSSTAWPSRRNSGFHTSSAPGSRSATRSATDSAVPTGTVDFPTTTSPGFSSGRMLSTAERTKERSAAFSFSFCGVPTHTKCTTASAARPGSVVNSSRPVASASPSSSSRPGSWNGALPAASAATCSSITSTPTTSWPSEAMHAACTAPR